MDGDNRNSTSSSSSSGSGRIQRGPSTSRTSTSGVGTKRQSSLSGEGDDDSRTEYSCPYCYEDYEIAVLCSHLEDEHCYESKVAVCPVCSTKVWKDMAGHITQQHSQLFRIQRRRRFRRSGAAASNATLSLLCKELREVHLQALLTPPSSADPFFSTLLSNQDNSQDHHSVASSSSRRFEDVAALSPQERIDMLREATLRANFVQQIVISSLYK